MRPHGELCARAGVQFADLGGSGSPVEVQFNARFVDCTFTDNFATGVSEAIVLATGTTTGVWLQACTLVNNTATLELVAPTSSNIFSNGPEQVYSSADSKDVQPQATPKDTSAFLSLEDDFIQDASKVRCMVCKDGMLQTGHVVSATCRQSTWATSRPHRPAKQSQAKSPKAFNTFLRSKPFFCVRTVVGAPTRYC